MYTYIKYSIFKYCLCKFVSTVDKRRTTLILPAARFLFCKCVSLMVVIYFASLNISIC